MKQDDVLVCLNSHLVCFFVVVNFQVAEITFNFWYRLSEELYQRNNQALTQVFRPYVQRLIIALCRHCQLDSDHVSMLCTGMCRCTCAWVGRWICVRVCMFVCVCVCGGVVGESAVVDGCECVCVDLSLFSIR